MVRQCRTRSVSQSFVFSGAGPVIVILIQFCYDSIKNWYVLIINRVIEVYAMMMVLIIIFLNFKHNTILLFKFSAKDYD